MSKFKVGDKVVFNRKKAQSDVDERSPGTDSWIRLVPKGPLTVYSVSEYVVKVEECAFWFSPDWLEKYEEPCKEGFKVGDKVWFIPEEVAKVDPDNLWAATVDKSKLYTVTEVSETGNLVMINDNRGFSYSPHWLKKAEEYKGRDASPHHSRVVLPTSVFGVSVQETGALLLDLKGWKEGTSSDVRSVPEGREALEGGEKCLM